MEYISNVYVDSEASISYTPVVYKDVSSVLTTPPAPTLDLVSRPVRAADGSISYVVDLNSSTDTSGYPINIQTKFDISYPDTMVDIIGISEPTSWNPEVQAYENYFVTNSIPFSYQRKVILNTFVTGMKTAGIFDLTDDFWVLAGENESQALVSFKNLLVGRTISAPPFLVNRGFIFNDGASNYMDTKFNNTYMIQATTASVHTGIYETSNVSTTGVYSFSMQGSTNGNSLYINPKRSTNRAQFFVMSGNSNASGESITIASNGFQSYSKTTSMIYPYKNGLPVATNLASTISSSLPNANLCFGAIVTSAYVASGHRKANVAFATIGGSLTSAQHASYNQLITNMLTTIGAI